MTLNLEELREAEALMARMAEHAEKILPVLKLVNEAGGRAILPEPADRLIHLGELTQMLRISSAVVTQLIAEGKLHPLYVGDSSRQKFRLSEVKQLPTPICPKSKVFNFNAGRRTGRPLTTRNTREKTA